MGRFTHDILPVLLAVSPQIPWQRNKFGTPLMKRLGHGGFMCCQAVAEIPDLNGRGWGILLIDWDSLYPCKYHSKEIQQSAEVHVGHFAARYGTIHKGISALAQAAKRALADSMLKYLIAKNHCTPGPNRAWGIEAKKEWERIHALRPWFAQGRKEKAQAIVEIEQQILEKVFGSCLINVSKEAGLLSLTNEAGAGSVSFT